MNGEQYNVATIVEMARIPEEAFDRFLAEFPLMVGTVRAHIALVEELYAAAGKDKPDSATIIETMHGVTWIDDDKGNISVNVAVEDEHGERANLINLKANYKSGDFDLKVGNGGEA